MRSRSRMAALALAASLAIAAPRPGLAQPAAPSGSPGASAPHGVESSVDNRVNLILQVSGLGTQGCQIEIKPAHRGCEFESIKRTIDRVPANAVIKLDGIAVNARSTGADRDCTFAITIREPGLPAKTYRRGLRLEPVAAGKPAPTQTLKCYLISPSVAAASAADTSRR